MNARDVRAALMARSGRVVGFTLWWRNLLPPEEYDRLFRSKIIYWTDIFNEECSDEELETLYARWKLETTITN